MAKYSRGRAEIKSPERTKIWVEPKLKRLYLRDVTNRLNFLRGQGMANMYVWSSKRSYKNGYVWQDLSENDFIYPCHGNEYILKGSQLLDKSISFRSYETELSAVNTNSSETSSNSSEDSNSPAIMFLKEGILNSAEVGDNKDCVAELPREEISPPHSRSSSQTIESLMDCIEADASADIRDQSAENDHSSRRMKATPVLMQLIGCGSRRIKDC
ncbi:hypothetical protein Patl1_33776 [Pistacia atlantica]|uniref:Uncharacterized protein n=1 Tax=Pistacia atlantica TaxID=434234 RepID=A0ACC0ZUD6_9ROSI|nr:hypothetical protein Patl1_33776 [Pistacia atlantica]